MAKKKATKKKATKKKTAARKISGNGANLSFEAKLWLAADKLRSNMDAAEYKRSETRHSFSPGNFGILGRPDFVFLRFSYLA